MSPRSNENQNLVSGQLRKKHVTSISCELEPAIWSRDTGQWIPCFDRCQLIVAWISIIREIHSKPGLHVSVNLIFELWPPCCATSSSSSPPSCAPTSNTASHENHEKINSWFPFVSHIGMGLCLATGAPLL